jgi:hypothetical protein
LRRALRSLHGFAARGLETIRRLEHGVMVLDRLRRYFILALVVALLATLYAAAGFWGVPRLVRSQLRGFVAEHYGRQVAVGEVRFNPFTLVLEVRDSSLPDADGQPMLAFACLRVDFDIASLWRRGFSFREIVLEQPFTRVLIRRDGTLNFVDLTKSLAGKEPEPQAADTKPTRLFIDRLTVRAGRSTFEDRTRAEPFRAELKPIGFELRDFSTTELTGNIYALAGASAAGERFSWNGAIRLNPLASQGRFELADVRVRTIWNYLRDSVHFEIASGVLGLNGDYDFKAAGSTVGLKLNVHDLTVSNLGLRLKGAVANSIDLARIDAHETSVDTDRRTVTIGKVQFAGGEIRAWLDAQTRLNLLDLAGPAAPIPAQPVARNDEKKKDVGWTVTAADLSLSELKLSVEDRQVVPAAVLAVNDLEARVVGFTTAPGAALDITAAAGINAAGKMSLAAKVSPDSGVVDANLELAQLDLSAIQPYLARQTQLTLRSGLLGAKLHVERAADGALTVEGDTEVSRLHTVDDAYQRDFIKWDRLRVRNVRYRSAPASLQIGSVIAQAPYARVIIAKDRSVNVSDVLRPAEAVPATEAPPPSVR